ncbi:MAG: hypothetical protein IPN96_22540 [Anaerolineales bacterium]|nr:hypothetical protein [Anaerolineales bacterium]
MNRIYSLAYSIYRRLPLALKSGIKAFVNRTGMVTRLRSGEVVNSPVSLDRQSKLLRQISPATQEGLEIGPLCWPIVTKTESNGHIYYVDFSTAEKSREKYKK